MTRQGGFKREVRRRARSTGQRYTQALDDLETERRQAFVRARPVDVAGLRDHLEQRYEAGVGSLSPIDDDPVTRPRGSWPGHYPSTLLVRRDGGPDWIARVFSSPVDSLARVEGDAEILRFLAEHQFPAERLAHHEPVSAHQGAGVLVTEFLEGGRPTDASGRSGSAAVHHELGVLLGRLHALPPGEGAVLRDGGAEQADGGFHVGRPARDLTAAMGFLIGVEDQVTPDGREYLDRLRDRVEQADDAEGLPEALTHSNFHVWAAVGLPARLSVVGWAGSGRGPRLPALAWLLTTAAEGDPELVDAVCDGYRRHVRLTDDELARLEAVMHIRPLWLACLQYRELVRRQQAPDTDSGWLAWGEVQARSIAARARAALGRRD